MFTHLLKFNFGRVTHFYSMLIAPLVLFLLTFVIMHIGGGWFTIADVAFLTALALLILGRRWPTSQQIPAKISGGQEGVDDFLQTPFGVAIVGMSVWGVANVIGNYLLPS